MREKKVCVSVPLPEQMNERLKKLAKDSGRTKAAYIRQILRRYMKYLDAWDDPDADPADWEP